MAELKAGALIEFSARTPITKEQLRSYADASGDPNPIHLDDQVAKRAGLPGIIAHGMLSAAFLAERAQKFMSDEVSAKDFRLKQFKTRFKAMTLLGDVISLGGEVKEVLESSVTLELSAKNQKGE
ncbi:MAG: MaoC family dehydratase, partial [Bdellovibrionota bacterium]